MIYHCHHGRPDHECPDCLTLDAVTGERDAALERERRLREALNDARDFMDMRNVGNDWIRQVIREALNN